MNRVVEVSIRYAEKIATNTNSEPTGKCGKRR